MHSLTKRERWIISSIFIIIFLVGLIYTYIHPDVHNTSKIFSDTTQAFPSAASSKNPHTGKTQSSTTNDSSSSLIKADIKGGVNHPGVYELPADSRIADAITAAGGSTPQADLNAVNLGAVILDAVNVYIRTKGNSTPA